MYGMHGKLFCLPKPVQVTENSNKTLAVPKVRVHKTSFLGNLRMGIMSNSVCPWKAFPV
jgi:hypothetical protein